MYSRSDDMNIRIHAMEKTGFNSKIQIQHGYKDCKHPLEHIFTTCADVLGLMKKKARFT